MRGRRHRLVDSTVGRLANGERLTVDWRYAANLHVAYDWLREQLCRRIPEYVGHYPWWAYDRRPDLRYHRHQLPQGGAFALLELRLPVSKIVCLPFWTWDRVFDHRYLAIDQTEAADWERRKRKAVPDEDAWPLPDPWHGQLLASWERLFNPSFPKQGPSHRARRIVHGQDIVFETLERSAVSSVERFRGANCRKTRRERQPEWLSLTGPTYAHKQAPEGG